MYKKCVQNKLSEEEIQRRLQKLRNYERLYPELQKKYQTLKKDHKELKESFIEMQEKYEAITEAQALRIEELEAMVFKGRKKKRNTDDDTEDENKKENDGEKQQEKKKRSKSSYRRAIPKQENITDTKQYELSCCPDCGEELMNRETIIRYLEDLILATAEKNPLKKVEEQHIECGYCKKCKKRHAAIRLTSQMCRLGENVRAFIAYSIINLGMTFEKAASLLRDMADIQVSDGEICNILMNEARKMKPEHEAIKERVRGSPACQYDETGYPVQAGEQGNFAWIKTASDSSDTIFLLGRTRGKGNAQELRGDDENIAVTDDYPGYDYIPEEKHALCWAHPHRKFRDLAKTKVLSKRKRAHCQKFYQNFSQLYKDAAIVHAQKFDLIKRQRSVQKFLKRIEALCVPKTLDPKKLQTLKATFLENKHKYMTCLLHEGVPMDNNKAERSLKPLIIKRKLSFGSKTQQGAEIMEVLCSVLFSLWWRKPQNFFAEYFSLIRL